MPLSEREAAVVLVRNNLQRVFRPPGESTPLYRLHRYKRRQKGWIFNSFGLK